MKKKTWYTALTLSLVALMATGCSGGKSEAKKSDDGKTHLTAVIVKNQQTKKNSEIEWLQKLEKEQNIDIKWQEVTADWDQKKSPMLASGDIPDFFIGTNVVTDSEFAKFPGLFEDLSDDLDSMPNVKKMFEEKPMTKTLSSQSDGKMYGLSKVKRFMPYTSTRQYINKEWLKNVGMKEPTTWDELFNVLKAFKEKDANGNGDPNDEIPMDWSPVGTGGFSHYQPMQLLASTGLVPSDGGNCGYYAEDGKVGNFFTDDRYKDVVKFLHKCWAAGLVNPKAFSQDYTAYKATCRQDSDTAKVGFTWQFEAGGGFGPRLAPQYESMAPLKQSATSPEPTWSYNFNNEYSLNQAVVSAKTKHKKAVLKFIDSLYNPETSLQVWYGSIGPNIEKDGDTYKILPPKDKKMDAEAWKWTSSWADYGPMFISDDLKVELPDNLTAVNDQTKPLQPTMDKIVPEKQVVPWGLMKYSEDDSTKLSNLDTTLTNEAMSKFAKWITKGGIDKDWDAYVKVMNKNGLQDGVDIVQKGFDQFYKTDK